MNALKRAFTPSNNKRTKKSFLPPLKGITRSTSKSNHNESDGDGLIDQYHKNEKNKKRDFAINNINVKDFTDQEIKQCFQDFDLDGNGFLCAAELKQCLKKLGEKVSDEEIDEMVKMCDQVTFYFIFFPMNCIIL